MAHPGQNLPKARLKELDGGGASVYCPRSYPRGAGWRDELCDGCVAQISAPEYVGGLRIWCLRSGWKQDEDGLVHEIKYSHGKRQRGHEGKYRQTPPYVSATPKGTKALSTRPILFPAQAVCPNCHRRMELDPDVPAADAPLVYDVQFCSHRANDGE